MSFRSEVDGKSSMILNEKSVERQERLRVFAGSRDADGNQEEMEGAM